MPCTAFSQASVIDSLQNVLKKYDAFQVEFGAKTPTIADSVKVNLLNRIALRYCMIDVKKCSDYASQALSLAKRINYPYGVGAANAALGFVLIANGNNDSALICFRQSLKTGEKLKDSSMIGTAFNNIGAYYDAIGDYSEAQKYFMQGLRLRERYGNVNELAGSYRNIGNMYLVMTKYDDALTYHHNSLSYALRGGDSLEIGDAYNGIANVHHAMHNTDIALKYYDLALKIALNNGFSSSVAFINLNMGDLYKDKGDLEHKEEDYHKALKYYKDALTYAEKAGNMEYLGYTNMSLGTLEETLGDLKSAEKHIRDGLVIAEKGGKKEMMRQAYWILAMIHYKQKNFKEAFENEQKYIAVYQELFQDETKKSITEMKLQYEFDKKEAAASAAQEKKNLIRNYIYGGMGLALMFLIILIVQRNKIAKERRQIALEQERTRISRDLHDDLGSGLTSILMMSEQLQGSSPQELVSNNLEKIKKSSRSLVEQMGEIVWAMNSKNDTLENLVGYLNTYTREYFEGMDLNYQVQAPEQVPPVAMTGMKRRNVFLVVKESLNNIAKHANATQVSLQVAIEKNNMSIVVSDNGKGFEKGATRRFGNGLKNMASRMQDIHGTYNIESAAGGGTKTTITFPLS